jgi:hypothetical protein
MKLKIISANSNQDLETQTNEFLAGVGNLILVKTIFFQSKETLNLLIFYTIK